jgi:predicted RNA-binding protein with PIN domain
MKKGWHEHVIDGYNLLHSLFPGKKKTLLEDKRKEAERLLLAFHRKTGNPVTIVYDGKERFREYASGAPLHIVFTPASKSADQWIVDYVKSLNTKIKLVTIVSSDNELCSCAAAYGARNIKSEDFAILLQAGTQAARSEKSRSTGRLAGIEDQKVDAEGLSEKEIQRWRKLFLKGKQ